MREKKTFDLRLFRLQENNSITVNEKTTIFGFCFSVLLKIHHNEKTHDEVKRIPFNYVCFDDLSHRAVAIDNR